MINGLGEIGPIGRDRVLSCRHILVEADGTSLSLTANGFVT
jgi:hypothetical protein